MRLEMDAGKTPDLQRKPDLIYIHTLQSLFDSIQHYMAKRSLALRLQITSVLMLLHTDMA